MISVLVAVSAFMIGAATGAEEEVLWSRDTKGCVFITPTVLEGRVYVGSCLGSFFAFDATTGTELWRYDTAVDGNHGKFHGDPYLTDTVLIVGSDANPKGYLYAFERATGAVRWKHSFAGGVPAQVVGYKTLAYAVGVSGEVLAVDTATGRVEWRFTETPPAVAGSMPSDPVFAHDRLFVAWRPGYVDALEPATGRLLWRQNLDSRIATSVAGTNSGVVVGTIDGHVHLLEVQHGAEMASYDLTGSPYGDLVVTSDCIVLLWMETNTSKDFESHKVGCLEPSLTQLRWLYTSDSLWTTFRPLPKGSELLVGKAEAIAGLNLTDGQLLWTRSIDGVPRGLGSSGSVLYVGMLDGRLLALPWRDTKSSTGLTAKGSQED